MSLQDIRVRTETELNNIYMALEEQGATIPEQKNLVNVAPTIASIEGSVEPEQPQVHNYLMLYDGTLGEAGENGANVCADVTGGYSVNDILTDNTYDEDEVNFSSTHVHMYSKKITTKGNSKMSTIITNNNFSVDGYKKIGCIAFANLSSPANTTWATVIIMENRGIISSSAMGEFYFVLKSEDLTGFLNQTKFVKSIDVANVINKKYYLACQASSTLTNESCELNLYSSFLVKQDPYQQILNLAGFTTIYTDEDSICADETAMTTILNNKEAVEYMIYNCTGTFMLAFIQSETALNVLNSSPYKVLVYQNDVWIKFLSMVA